MIHIADHLPQTHAALKEEVARIEKHLKLLQGALQGFEALECNLNGEITSSDQEACFEVVCPQEHPGHSQGKARRKNLPLCADRASEMSGRNGPLYAFLNVNGASIAISPFDFSNLKLRNHEKDGRVCWTETERSTIWLV